MNLVCRDKISMQIDSLDISGMDPFGFRFRIHSRMLWGICFASVEELPTP